MNSSPGKRVIVAGATGLIGKALCRRLMERGYEVVVFSRKQSSAMRTVPGAAAYVSWQPEERGAWAASVSGAYAVINLAGASVFGRRWSDSFKRELRDSRIIGTRGLVNAMAAAADRPQVYINGSAIGYYGHRDDAILDESAGPGNDFLARLVVDWEREGQRAEQLGIRTVLVRTGIVLDKDEGALAQMMLPFKFYAGGPILPGTQWFSWIHISDEIGILLKALEDERVQGPINATAPNPQTNAEFTRALGRALGKPAWVAVPGPALRLVLGEVADSLTTGQRVIPEKAQSLGYQFLFPTSASALSNLLGG